MDEEKMKNCLSDTPEHRKRVREHLLMLPVVMPDMERYRLSPEQPYELFEYRFNASGDHIKRHLGAYPTENEARAAGLRFLDAAERFTARFDGVYIGNEVHEGRTYQCYSLWKPADIIGFAYDVELFS